MLTRAAYDLIDRHRVYTDISEASFGALMIAGLLDAGDETCPSSYARCYRDMAMSVLRQLPPIDYSAVTDHSAPMPTVDVRAEHAQSRTPMGFFAILIGASTEVAAVLTARRRHLGCCGTAQPDRDGRRCH